MPSSFSEPSLPKTPWSHTPDDVLHFLESTHQGLSQTEAELRLKHFGPNEIRTKQRLSHLQILLDQCKSPLIWILFIASIITLFSHEWLNSGVILATILVNIALGYWQENKAETVLEALKSYVRTRVRVRRDDEDHELDAHDLVPGDIIHLTQGDRIPADARLWFVNNLKVDESILTGESLPVEKSLRKTKSEVAVSDRVGMIHSGTLVVEGLADAVVTATGDQTEFGRIAHLITSQNRETTPLQKEVAHLALQISIVLGVLVSVFFAIGLATGQRPFDMFLVAVAVAVSAVPEGLPIALTVILAIGVERLAKRKGIVRKLLAAESLGATNLILTDKTGTLTQAKMEVTDLIPIDDASSHLLRDAILTTDVVVENPHEAVAHWRIIGKPMEAALVRFAAHESLHEPDLRRKIPLLDRLPFNSKQKFAGVVVKQDGQRLLLVLGAPDVLLERTDVDQATKQSLLAQIHERAVHGERLLGLASKVLGDKEDIHDPKTLQDAFDFRGMIALRDPLRPHMKEAIQHIAESGVETIIVTGDHEGTAEHIGRELGIVEHSHQVVTGAILATWSKEERRKHADKIRVYARLTPEQKLELVHLYQGQGKQVAVTGDGVNDAPALHIADVGIAIGSGTEVAKSAADLIILDDNFETIVAAIDEGRLIRQNIRKVITYLLSNASNELVLIGGSLLLGLPIPLTAINILYINFFSDSFPAIAFAFETQREPGRAQHATNHTIINREMRFLILGIGTLSSLLVFFAYRWLLSHGFSLDVTRTLIFAAFASYTLLFAFSLRNLKQQIWQYNPFGNRALNIGVCVGLALITAGVYVPFLQGMLGTVSIPVLWFLGAIGSLSMVNLAAVEFGKWIYRKR